MAIAEINIIPLGTPGPSVAEYVRDAVGLLERRGIQFEVTAMGTIIEGDVATILELAREMHETPFHRHVRRVVTTIRIDDRRDRKATARGKVEAVRGKLRERDDPGCAARNKASDELG